jgi:opacity protein-like surface antigen
VPGLPVQANTSASNVNNLNTGVAVIALGYNFAIDNSWLVGLGASMAPGGSSGATGQLNVNAPVNAALGPYSGRTLSSTVASYQMKNSYSITVNPGYAFDKDKMAYMMLGYTGTTIGLSSPVIAYNTVNLSGYTVGLGYKQMVTPSLYLLGEVKYASFGQTTASTTSSNGVAISQPVSANAAEVLIGVGYRF